MLRNRRKNVRKRNTRNGRSRSNWENVSDDEDSQSNCSFITSDFEFDSDDSSELSDSPVLGRRRSFRKQSTAKVNVNTSTNENLNCRNRNDLNEAGPSNVRNNSNYSRIQSRNGTAKRKYKEKTKKILDSESSSSDEVVGRSLLRSNIKRLKTSDLDSDDSESSNVQPVRSRRPSLINLDSSGSSSDQIVRPSGPRLLCSVLSDDTENSSEEEDSSPVRNDFFAGARFISNLRNTNNMDSFETRVTINNPSPSSSSTSSLNFSTSSNSNSSTFSSSSLFSLSLNSDVSNESGAYSSARSNRILEQILSSDSDSSDTDGEKCAICLKKFKKQRIGNPSNCDHSFCVNCIKEWSKSSTTCPVDRSIFDAIIVRDEVDGNVIERIEVQARNFGVFSAVDIEDVFMNGSIICEVCGSGEDGETLLLCDLCNLGYHMACLNPPLSTIPEGSWYCPPCRELQNENSSNVRMNETMQRFMSRIPVIPLNLSSSSRQTRNRTRNGRSRPVGPPPAARGPRFMRRFRTAATNFPMNRPIIWQQYVEHDSILDNDIVTTEPMRQKRKKNQKRNRKKRPRVPRNVNEVADITQRMHTRTELMRSSNTQSISSIDLVFPSFNLFEQNTLDFFSEGEEDHSLDGEMAIMARVRREYSARRVENRKNMITSLVNNYQNRRREAIVVPEIVVGQSTSNLLDSILHSQTLWHSKNVEISSKKDGTLEVKLKDEIKKPDLSNTNHSSKEIPLFPNKNENSSSNDTNKSYTNNTRYSNLGGGSSSGGNSFSLSTSSFNSLNPSTRPGFSNILGNSSPALDLSPFRGSAPIRFRMNPPRPALRRPNFNSNSVRHGISTGSVLNSVQSPRKTMNTSSTTGGDDEVDLYEDIESENVESEKIPEMFSSLEPPPEPPALLIGSDTSSDEDDGLVIDDKAASNTNKNNIYDPTEPNEDSDIESNQDKNTNIIPGYLRSPSYGGLSEFGPHLPLPEPPALPIELDSVNNSEEDEDEAEAECPNMTLYSTTSINLANNVQDIPIPESTYPLLSQEELEYIPIPSTLPSEKIPLPRESSPKPKVPTCELYSPSKKDSTDSSSAEDNNDDDVEEIISDKSPPSVRSDEVALSRSSSADEYSSESSDELSSSNDEDAETEGKSKKKRAKKERVVNGEVLSDKKRKENNSLNVVDIRESDEFSEDVDLNQDSSSPVAERDDEMVSKTSAEDRPEKADEQEMMDVETEVKKCRKDEEDFNVENENKINDDKNAVESSFAGIESEKRDDEEEVDNENTKITDEFIESIRKSGSADTETDVSNVGEEVDENMKTLPTTVQLSSDATEHEKDDEMVKDSLEANTSNAYLLPSDDLDPVSDVEYNDFPEYHKQSSSKDRRKKRKKGRRRDPSVDAVTSGATAVADSAGSAGKTDNRELEEGEIEDEKTKRKRLIPHKRRKSHSESEEHTLDKKQKRKKDKRDRRSSGKENKESMSKNDSDFRWKKLSRNTKERNYRDGKAKGGDKSTEGATKNRVRDSLKSKKEKRKEMERYDVRKIVSDKPRTMRDEFGRDISVPRSHSRTRSRSVCSRRRSKGPSRRRSFSQDDRWIDWSPLWTQRRSRSRTRRSRSRSRNRSRLSGDRYRNRSKNRERDYDKHDARKRRRSLSSALDKYSPVAHESKKRRRSKERARKSGSYTTGRPSCREVPDYFYERSWSRSISYASLTPEPDPYVSRYDRSPSVIEAGRIPIVSPNPERDVLAPNPQNLTVIVPNVDVNKKKHKKKKESKKKKKKQPSKEVFTSGDNIVVSVNFDDNQKIISAKSSKRKHDEEKVRKKKKDESTRKKRKQILQVSDEVLNAKPVAVIDLNSSPCKEMSPTEVISLTDSGDDETVANEDAVPTVRRTPQEYSEAGYQTNENTTKSPSEHRAYVMTSAGPKTPPEPPIKFTVGSTAPMRTLPTNPIFEQDEEIEHEEEESVHYNKGPNTPPEPSNETRRSITPNATMYDPFEPTKSRSPSPENVEMYEERKDTTTPEERRPIIDMFSEEGEKSNDNQNAEKSKNETDTKEKNSPVEVLDESSTSVVNKTSPVKETLPTSESSAEMTQTSGVNTLVLDLSSLGDDFVPKSSIPLVKTSQGKYEFQSGKTPDKPITVVIAQQSTSVKPQPQQVMVIPTRQVPTKPVEPIKQPIFPDILPWKLPTPMSQPSSFSTPPPTTSTIAPTHSAGNLITPSKSVPGALAQNGGQEDTTFELDDSPYSPASSEGDDLFEPPPLNAGSTASPKTRPAPIPAVNSYKARVDALFTSSPIKKLPPRSVPHPSKPVSAIKGSKKITKTLAPSKKEVGIKADEEQLKILDDVPNSAVEMIVKEKFLKKLHRQERVVEEVKVVLKPHYAKKHITKEEYKDILRRAVPKICHNKSGDINPSKIQSLVEAYVKKIRHSKKKVSSLPGSSAAPMFPSMTTGKSLKKQKSLWS